MRPQPAVRHAAMWGLLLSVFLAVPLATRAACVPAHVDHPSATLTGAGASAVIFLPDPVHGSYRAARFDWSGIVACLEYRGHTVWGEWFPASPGSLPANNPLRSDAVTGPAEEFRSVDQLGYSTARPGEPFVKVGVGLLRRIDSSPYSFGVPYPILDGGRWTTRIHAHAIVFQQRLTSSLGIAYLYTKTLALDPDEPVLTLTHSLRNIGTVPLVTDVYDHDFFTLDGHPTGPAVSVHLPFPATPDAPFDPAFARIEPDPAGSAIRYTGELPLGTTVGAYLSGFTSSTPYRITVQDDASGLSVSQTADTPFARFYLWSIRSTLSPEAYIPINVQPGKTQRWTIRYRFALKPAS